MKKLSFGLLTIVLICLAVTTFIEKYQGTQYVSQYIYGSVWFSILWGGLAISSLCYILSVKVYKKSFSIFSLHASFLVILLGALLTSLTAQRGYIHLRMNEKSDILISQDEDGNERRLSLPLTLELTDFSIDYYPGTNAPADYISSFRVTDENNVSFQESVSMNRIFSYKGIRLYQSSYDEDMQGAILTVNRDAWGIPITYTGYFLLFISMLWVLFAPNGSMRRLLKNPLLRKNACMFTLLLIPLTSLQAKQSADNVLLRSDAAKLGEVQVLYNGRITLLQTLAYDFSKKVTGSVNYKGYTPEQFLSGWIFYPGLWKYEPCIHVKSAAVRKMFNLNEYAALTDFFDQTSTYIFESYWSELHQGKPSSLQKSISEVDEKVQLILMLSKGELLKVFPVTEHNQTIWCNSTAQLPDNIDTGQRLFVKKMFALLNEQVIKRNSEQFHYYVEKLLDYQWKNGGESVLSSSKVKAELTYNRIPYIPLLYRINLTLGLLILILLMTELVRQKTFACSQLLFKGGVVSLLFSFLFLTFCIALRTYISGRWPMGNGFETMVFMAWCIMLIALLFYKKFRLIVPFGFLLSGFFLLVASFSMMNPQITPLMPVLSSPLLSLHVSTIMMSYALLAFTFLGGVISLFLFVMKRNQQTEKQIETLKLISQLFLIPGLFFLAAGIFIGAIWANISWGRYWAWDPKEVWALITLLVYCVAVHTQSLRIFRKPIFFHVYMCLSFLTVLMTYFGVNYVLGGLHSYA